MACKATLSLVLHIVRSVASDHSESSPVVLAISELVKLVGETCGQSCDGKLIGSCAENPVRTCNFPSRATVCCKRSFCACSFFVLCTCQDQLCKMNHPMFFS